MYYKLMISQWECNTKRIKLSFKALIRDYSF